MAAAARSRAAQHQPVRLQPHATLQPRELEAAAPRDIAHHCSICECTNNANNANVTQVRRQRGRCAAQLRGGLCTLRRAPHRGRVPRPRACGPAPKGLISTVMLLKYCVFPWRYDLGALANAPAGAAHPWGRTRVTGARGLLGGRVDGVQTGCHGAASAPAAGGGARTCSRAGPIVGGIYHRQLSIASRSRFSI